jgi:ABC-2 type transport system permease protein
VAAILRSSALALGVLLVFLGVVFPLLVRTGATKAVAQYLPDQAGSQIIKVGLPHSSMLGPASSIGPWAGLAIMAAWTLAALACGYLTLRTRS